MNVVAKIISFLSLLYLASSVFGMEASNSENAGNEIYNVPRAKPMAMMPTPGYIRDLPGELPKEYVFKVPDFPTRGMGGKLNNGLFEILEKETSIPTPLDAREMDEFHVGGFVPFAKKLLFEDPERRWIVIPIKGENHFLTLASAEFAKIQTHPILLVWRVGRTSNVRAPAMQLARIFASSQEAFDELAQKFPSYRIFEDDGVTRMVSLH